MQASGQLASKPEGAEIHRLTDLNHSSPETRNFEGSKKQPFFALCFVPGNRMALDRLFRKRGAGDVAVPLTIEPSTILPQLHLELCQATGDGRGKIIAATNFST